MSSVSAVAASGRQPRGVGVNVCLSCHPKFVDKIGGERGQKNWGIFELQEPIMFIFFRPCRTKCGGALRCQHLMTDVLVDASLHRIQSASVPARQCQPFRKKLPNGTYIFLLNFDDFWILRHFRGVSGHLPFRIKGFLKTNIGTLMEERSSFSLP